jgi:hypothetical protein
MVKFNLRIFGEKMAEIQAETASLHRNKFSMETADNKREDVAVCGF